MYRVALIHCVSGRLPWRLFDPVFQSLPLGQTCFSSVCCTPALEAAAAPRWAMGRCARLAASPPAPTRTHPAPFSLPVVLTFPLFFQILFIFLFCFHSGSLHPSVSLTCSASLWSRRSTGIQDARVGGGGGEEARTSAKQPSWEEKSEGKGTCVSLPPLLTLTFCLHRFEHWTSQWNWGLFPLVLVVLTHKVTLLFQTICVNKQERRHNVHCDGYSVSRNVQVHAGFSLINDEWWLTAAWKGRKSLWETDWQA